MTPDFGLGARGGHGGRGRAVKIIICYNAQEVCWKMVTFEREKIAQL